GRGVVGRVLGVAPVLVLHPGRAEGARVVARARALDLDHFGAEIGEVLPRPRAGEHARKIEDADVRERSRHEFSGRWRRGILSESVAPALRNATIAEATTEPGMRSLRWRAMCAAALCAPLVAAAQQQPSDYAREKRWADEIVPQLVSGEPVWLEAPRTEKFLGIYTEAKNAKGAIILAHGLGVHPDYGLIGELRTRLAAAGFTTLRIQLPILAADAPAARYPVLFWEADARFAAAMTYLKRKRYEKVVLLSHSMGSRMANHYVGAHPQVPLAGWIALSISSGCLAAIEPRRSR